jgi:Asp-tRNA(Asn)/Glu-tRNA(Gln) amidotransferase A subunit family amidase
MTPVEVCLQRIAERDEQVRAWTHLDPEQALAQERAAAGRLGRLPVGVKDIIDTADMPTSYGSPIYAGHQPHDDAVCVARLREAGAVILGKTVTTEFDLYHPGPTRNPHDLTRTPGGSSSGSAAAVADGMVPVALGTQTAGSIVRPASFCGVFGFKPTFGLIPTDGVKACAPSLDTVGVFARDVVHLAAVTSVMAAADVRVGPEPQRIAFVRTAEWDHAEPATREAVEGLASDVGARPIDLPESFAGLVAAQERLMAHEAAASLASERAEHTAQCSPRLLALLETGDAVTVDDVRAALRLRHTARAELDEFFAQHDALLAPAVLGEAPLGLDATGDPLFCRMWTLLGNPCVAVPGLRGPNGLPLGVQVIAPLGRDAAALGAARWLSARMHG